MDVAEILKMPYLLQAVYVKFRINALMVKHNGPGEKTNTIWFHAAIRSCPSLGSINSYTHLMNTQPTARWRALQS